MTGLLALLVIVVGIGVLFRRDAKATTELTSAIWIPFTWILISGSRLPSEWLQLGTSYGASSFQEGSAFDRVVLFGLIFAGIWVLSKRGVKISEFVRSNSWLALYLVYGFLAIFWSDFPMTAFKRWIKGVGEPIMVLVLLTESKPADAISSVMKRASYVLIPISIVLIRYFPQWGRTFSQWNGQAQNTGVTLGKNSLGYVCAVLGVFLCWHFLNTRKLPKSKERRTELALTAGFIGLTLWVLLGTGSSTALVSLVVGVLTMVVVGWPVVSKRFIGTYVLIGIAILVVSDLSFGLFSSLIAMLGRDETLTGRTDLWPVLWNWDINRLIGAGYESFWMGERLEKLWDMYWWKPQTAHNGYLESYLHLGLIGLSILILMLLATFGKIRRELLRDFAYGRVRLGMFAAAIVYNWTEAAFRPLHFILLAFYIIAIDYPMRAASQQQESHEPLKLGGTRARSAHVGAFHKASRPRAVPARRSTARASFRP
jgi:exopolysaccharide production protein ExoQ